MQVEVPQIPINIGVPLLKCTERADAPERSAKDLPKLSGAANPATVVRESLKKASRFLCAATAIFALLPGSLFAQQINTFTWEQLKQKFETTNPTLRANELNNNEARAEEVTAYLRPNPDFSFTFDQINPFTAQPPPNGGSNVYSPFAYALPSFGVDYLHERRHKRELRLQQARQTTDVTVSTSDDQKRTLLFTLRNAFVQVLQAKAILQNAKDNLAYWDHELKVNRERLNAGDLAQIDYDRLALQRAQFESDFESATVNERTSKIQLLQLLNDRTPIEQFDVTGTFDFSTDLKPLQALRDTAVENRPDLKAAIQSIELAQTSYNLEVANGSTDPTFSVDIGRNPPIPAYLGITVSIPLRIFDRNQGEKARTLIDIGRTKFLKQAAQAQVFNDVDSAYVTMESALNLLKPYKEQYLDLATRIRDRVTFAYQHGGSSLLDYLEAEKAYRDTRLAYFNLVGSYLTAAAQLNLAVGQEVM